MEEYPDSFTSVHTTAKPTMRLRWAARSLMQAGDYVLQQAWEIIHYVDSRPVKIETEWRDIPHEGVRGTFT